MQKPRIANPVLVIVAILVAVSFFVPTTYVMVAPGTTEDLAGMVEVQNGGAEERGVFQLVTIKQRQSISVPVLLYALVHPEREVRQRVEVMPPDVDEEEYWEIVRKQMQESEEVAKIVALRQADYEVEVRGKGIEVHDIMEGSPSQGVLQEGDVIREVDGVEVELANEVISQVQEREIGETVNLKIERNGRILEKEVSTTEHTDTPGKAALGIYITTLGWEADLPVDIEIDAGNIGGPSAGLMFVLEILNQLWEEDIAGGEQVAGTGAIDLEGNVTSVGGVKHKVRAAEDREASYFLVPSGNYEEARNAASQMEVIEVNTLEEALEALESIRAVNARGALDLWELVHPVLDKHPVLNMAL